MATPLARLLRLPLPTAGRLRPHGAAARLLLLMPSAIGNSGSGSLQEGRQRRRRGRPFSTAASAASASTVPRPVIGLFGCMNAGKSTLLNALTQQATAIVDKTPGTTADVKAALMELHGLGPVKLLDTAGVDDSGELGEKKKAKSLQALKEVDLALLVVDPFPKAADRDASTRADPGQLALLGTLVAEVTRRGRQAMLVFNVRADLARATGGEGVRALTASIEAALSASALHPDSTQPPLLLPSFTGDFSRPEAGKALALHLVAHMRPLEPDMPLVPDRYRDKVVLLNIPMDAETPAGRLLRPQALLQEECLRRFIPTVAYRMDLAKARSSDPGAREAECRRFVAMLRRLPPGSLVVTDSQAVDVVDPWTRDLGAEDSELDLTTFSVAMIHRMSGGRLQTYVDGLAALLDLRAGERVLVAEACNHVRIPEQCDDIGLVQIPRKLAQLLPGVDLKIEHAYGREFPSAALREGRYRLVVHCGGCMIDRQKIRARMEDCEEAGVAMTNYGLLLAFGASPQALLRAVRPYGIQVPQRLQEWAPPPPSRQERRPASCEHLLLLPEKGAGCSRRECPLCADARHPTPKS